MKEIHVRLNDEAEAAIEKLRRQEFPTPSVAEILRRAVIEQAKRAQGKRQAQG